MKNISWTLSAISLFLITGSCMYTPENFTEKTLVLKRDETVSIKQLDLRITNKGCGRKWLVDNGGERPFCELEVKAGDSLYRFGDSFEPFYIKNIELKIARMNPWNLVEDSVPPGGCRIIIKKLPGSSR